MRSPFDVPWYEHYSDAGPILSSRPLDCGRYRRVNKPENDDASAAGPSSLIRSLANGAGRQPTAETAASQLQALLARYKTTARPSSHRS